MRPLEMAQTPVDVERLLREASRREEELLAAGWTRQFSAEEPRLSEWVALYEAMGMEVHLEPLTPDLSQPCQVCIVAGMVAAGGPREWLIYTRPNPGASPSEDDDLP